MNVNVDSNAPAVNLSDLSLNFGEKVKVLNSVNLQLNIGEHAALIGRSGAGKTSLLAIIGGLLAPSGGKVETLGNDLATLDEDARAALRRDKIGMVFQHFHLLETMTALENAALPLELASQPDAKDRARQILADIGMGDRVSHFPSQLSGGEQQRVAIARAFVSNPALVLADEPTGNLDDDTSRLVLDTLFELGGTRNATMLFVTHNTAILERFPTVLQIKNGKVTAAESANAANV